MEWSPCRLSYSFIGLLSTRGQLPPHQWYCVVHNTQRTVKETTKWQLEYSFHCTLFFKRIELSVYPLFLLKSAHLKVCLFLLKKNMIKTRRRENEHVSFSNEAVTFSTEVVGSSSATREPPVTWAGWPNTHKGLTRVQWVWMWTYEQMTNSNWQ